MLVFHWNLNDSMDPKVSKNVLNIPADIYNALDSVDSSTDYQFLKPSSKGFVDRS